jgi:hypothetical protein
MKGRQKKSHKIYSGGDKKKNNSLFSFENTVLPLSGNCLQCYPLYGKGNAFPLHFHHALNFLKSKHYEIPDFKNQSLVWGFLDCNRAYCRYDPDENSSQHTYLSGI